MTDGPGAEVEVLDNPPEARYEIRVGGELAGFLTYRLRDGRIALVHTEVDDARSGHGLGSELVRAALEDVRERRLALEPICPFVTAMIRRSPELYLDLVAPGMRERVMRSSEAG